VGESAIICDFGVQLLLHTCHAVAHEYTINTVHTHTIGTYIKI